MSTCRSSLLKALIVLLVLCVPFLVTAGTQELACCVVDIDHIGYEALTAIKETEGVSAWLELGAELLACGSEPAIVSITRSNRLVRLYKELDLGELSLTLGLTTTELTGLDAEVVASGGRAHLVRLDRTAFEQWRGSAGHPKAVLRPVVPNTVVVHQLANSPAQLRAPARATVLELVEEIDSARWFSDLSTLAAWDRHTLRSDVLLARNWLVQQLAALPGLSVSTESFSLYTATGYNVVARLDGRTRPDDWYIVGGHYDSTAYASTYAPGAEDNASGCAGVLELARIFTAHPPEGTMLFICYSGEEQGLYGSADHAADLVAAGDDTKVKAMLDMDMIGYTADATLDCVLESETLAATMVDALVAAATTYAPTLDVSVSWYAEGSDHVSYLDEGMPAVLTIDDWNEYPYYHTVNDTPNKIVVNMGYQMLRMNVAAMAELAGADSSLFSDGFESGDLSAWSATVP